MSRAGPGVNKLSDRSTPMVFLGYETGTKGYRVYDHVAKKLHISRDVIFEEGRAWQWKQDARADPVASVFDVEYYTVAGQGTVTEEDAGSEEAVAADEGSLVQGAWQIDDNTDAGLEQLTPPGSPTQGVEFATPQTRNTVDSEGVPRRFRTLENICGTSDEVHDFEYSGMCFFATEEPRSVEKALSEKCWREAMAAEMSSIQANKT